MSVIDDEWEVATTLRFVALTHACSVALQFPPESLHAAPSVLLALQRGAAVRSWLSAGGAPRAAPRFFILGDTAYGSCCVDEVAAAHYSADAVVHYGHSCLTPTSDLPSFHVAGPRAPGAIAVAECAAALAAHVASARDAGEHVLLVWDADLADCLAEILAAAAGGEGVQGDTRSNAAAGARDVVALRGDGVGPPHTIDAASEAPEGAAATAAEWSLPQWTHAFASPWPHLLVPSCCRVLGPLPGRTGPPPPGLRVFGLYTDAALLPPTLRHSLLGEVGGDALAAPASTCAASAAAASAAGPPALRVLYLGSREARVRALVASYATCCGGVWALDPRSGAASAASDGSARAMAARYRLVGVIKRAHAVGIVAGTLAVARHAALVAALRGALQRAGKCAYTLLVGKVTPPKLANFAGACDAFVLLACAETSLLGDAAAAEHALPVATPYEALVALDELAAEAEAERDGGGDEGGLTLAHAPPRGALAWDGRVDLAFQSLLERLERSNCGALAARIAAKSREAEEVGNGVADEAADGAVDGAGGGEGARGGAAAAPSSSALALRNAATALAALQTASVSGTAGERLLRREWRGLAYDAPEGAAIEVREGSTGVAAGYTRAEGEGKR